LDYWMNIEEREERYSQKYAERLDVNSPLAPFTLCHLISGTNIDGKFLENAYDYCMNVTAENITNFMADEQKQSGEEFAIQDYQSNLSANIGQMTKHYAANYKYNIIGASAAVLPTEEITTYMAYRLFVKIQSMFAKTPEKNEVEELSRRVGLDLASVENKFQDGVPPLVSGFENNNFYSFDNVIKFRRVDMDRTLTDTFLSKAAEEYAKHQKNLPFVIMDQITARVREIFVNAEYGPIYASRLISSEKSFSLMSLIDVYIEQVRKEILSLPQQIEEARISCDEKFYDAQKSLFLFTEKKKNEYVAAKLDEYELRARLACYEQMQAFYEKINTTLI